MKPNILLLMTDQLRGDCIGAAASTGHAGNPDVKTPYLDTLAATGDYFPNAYTACPSCIAARATLMTGLNPRHTGRVGYRDGVCWDYPRTLAGELHNAGYYTQCVGKLHVHPLRNNLGFDNVLLHDGYLGYYRKPDTPYCEHQTVADDYFHWLKCELGADADITDTGIECNSWVARPWPYEERYHPTNWVASNALDFLRRRDRSKPFFLYASFVRPHPPFDAPQCYFDLYSNRELALPAVGDWCEPPAWPGGRKYDGDDGIADPELLRQAQAGYYACVTHLDHQIGRILQALEQDGSRENTIILFCADHGELLGDHHTYRKIRPYQGSIRIPLIWNLPGGHCGAVHSELAALQDIMPTLLDLAGGDSSGLDGCSLAPLLTATPETAPCAEQKPTPAGETCESTTSSLASGESDINPIPPRESALTLNRELCESTTSSLGSGESDISPILRHGCKSAVRSYIHGEHSAGALGNQYIVTQRDKYVWFMESGREQYFDLASDPRELHDGIADPANRERIAELRNILIRELGGREEGYTDGTRLIPGRNQRAVLAEAIRQDH